MDILAWKSCSEGVRIESGVVGGAGEDQEEASLPGGTVAGEKLCDGGVWGLPYRWR